MLKMQLNTSSSMLQKKLNTADAYKKYISEFPNGRYIPEIPSISNPAESKAWSYTRQVDSFFQYNWFIDRFPNSKFLKKAKELRYKRQHSIDQLKN